MPDCMMETALWEPQAVRLWSRRHCAVKVNLNGPFKKEWIRCWLEMLVNKSKDC